MAHIFNTSTQWVGGQGVGGQRQVNLCEVSLVYLLSSGPTSEILSQKQKSKLKDKKSGKLSGGTITTSTLFPLSFSCEHAHICYNVHAVRRLLPPYRSLGIELGSSGLAEASPSSYQPHTLLLRLLQFTTSISRVHWHTPNTHRSGS